MSRYDDIIHLPHYQSERRAKVPLYDRAAQFSPFAALTGYEAVIEETGRLTDRQVDLDEGSIAMINESLRILQERSDRENVVTAVWFVPDERKSGGTYEKKTGTVKKVDAYEQCLVFTDGTRIPFDCLLELSVSEG